jgi:hypothetical protein
MSAETVAIRVGVTANTVRRSVTRDGVEIFLGRNFSKSSCMSVRPGTA